METITKICTKCNIKKILSEFHTNKSKKSGFSSICKKCDNLRRKNSYNNLIKNLTKEQRDAINMERREKYSTTIYRNKSALESKKYYIKNKKRIIEKISEYNKTVKGKIIKRCQERKRKSYKKNANDNTINKKSLLLLKEIQNNKCYYCNCDLDFQAKNKVHLDHYIPLSKGGIHSIKNVVWSCAKCNMKKSVKIPDTLLIL